MKEHKFYTYKNKEYLLLHNDLEIKDSHSREWVRGVMYQQIETGLLFVREYKEFIERFEEVNYE